MRLKIIQKRAEAEEKGQLKGSQGGAQKLEERAMEGKGRTEVEPTRMETEEGVVKWEMETEKEEKGEEKGLEDEHPVEGERPGEGRPRENGDEEMMEEGQAPKTEFESVELLDLLTRPQKEERSGHQEEIKIRGLRPLEEGHDVQLPDAPPPAPMEKMDTSEPAQVAQGRFEGRETWDITIKVGDKVRIEQMTQNARGEMEEPIEMEFSIERFFDTMETWPRYIRSFKFQNDEVPPLFKQALRRGLRDAE